MKVLILGSNGQIGKSIKKISNNYNFDFIFCKRSDLDFNNSSLIDIYIKKINPEIVINCVAYTDVVKAEIERKKSNIINNTSLAYVAKSCADINSFLIHFSTDYVFNGKKNIPYKENDLPDPINYYGITKLNGEKQIINSNTNFLILRTSWVFSEFGTNFLKKMISLSKNNNELKVISDQFGKPTYATEIARAILENLPAIYKNKKKLLHFSGKDECSWFDFAALIIKLAYEKKNLNTIPYLKQIKSLEFKNNVERPSYSSLNNEKFFTIYRFKMKNLEENVIECLDNLQDNS